MSEINKLLWFLLTLSINGLISIIISHNLFSMYLLGFL